MTETCGGCVYDGMPLDGVRVAAGQDGRIRIAGPVLFTRYRRRPGLTREVLAGGWFTTSDLGSVGPSGRLTVRGRADDVINTGGEKVIAGEVAAVLETCAAVRAAVVVGRPDDEWGERVTAVVVPADPAAPPVLNMLRTHVLRVLPPAAAPRELMLVAEMPLLPSGKPDLQALRTLHPQPPAEPGTIAEAERYLYVPALRAQSAAGPPQLTRRAGAGKQRMPRALPVRGGVSCRRPRPQRHPRGMTRRR